MTKVSTLKNQFILTTALVGAFFAYGRRAYAACATTGVPPNYLCNGANAVTQFIGANNATVTTSAGFSVNANAGNAITITGDGALSYTDTNASSVITTGFIGLSMNATANDGGGTPGSVTIDSNGTIQGIYGIITLNSGSGASNINIDGTVTAQNSGISSIGYASNTGITITTGAGSTITGTTSYGIVTQNIGVNSDTTITADGIITGAKQAIFGLNESVSRNLSISTIAGSSVTGTTDGVTAINRGIGSTTITADGDITTAGNKAIEVITYATTTDLTVTTGVTSSIDAQGVGLGAGIWAEHAGSGEVSITANGAITAGYRGIYAKNTANGTDITVTADLGSTITSATAGIIARGYGTGAVSINANGTITADQTGVAAISANASSSTLTVTTGVGSNISSAANKGIGAYHYGTDALTITANGDITASDSAIYARIINANSSDINISTSIGTTITSTAYNGIHANNQGTGVTNINANGIVQSSLRAIYAINSSNGSDINVTTGAGSAVSSTSSRAINVSNTGTGSTSITTNGDVSTAANDSVIYARSSGVATDMNITVALNSNIIATSIISSYGISTRHYGSGNQAVTVDGTINSLGQALNLFNFGADLIVTTGSDSVLTSDNAYAIQTVHYGTGLLHVTTNGDVLGGIGSVNNSGSGLTIDTGANSLITGRTNYNGILGINSNGNFNLNANNTITGGSNGIYAGNSGAGQNLTIITSASSSITGSTANGILAYNTGSGSTNITASGDIIGSTVGIFADQTNTATDLNVTIDASASTEGTTNFGLDIRNKGSGTTSITNNGLITGDAGIRIRDTGTLGADVINNTGATIEGTGGTAISMNGLTSALDLTINGGRIIGNVDDNAAANGFSNVEIDGDFTSEGNFNVSDFNISSGNAFTFGTGKTITSFNTVDVLGEMIVSGIGSSVTGDLRINNGGTLSANNTFAINGALRNNGTISIATGKTLTATTMGSGTGNLSFGVTSLANHAQLTVTGGAANLTGQTITIDVAGVNSITANDQILLIDGTGAIVGGPGGTETDVVDNSFLWDFKIVDGTGISTPTDSSDLFLIIPQSTLPSCSGNTQNNLNACGTLLPLDGGTANPELLDILANFNGAPDQKSFNDVLEAVQPAMDAGAISSVLEVSGHTLDLTGTRLQDLGDGYGSAGYEASFAESGSGLPKSLVWAARFGDEGRSGFGNDNWGPKEWEQVFGQTSKQDRRDGIDGYSAHTVGGAFGADTGNVFNNGTIGLAFSYANTDVKSDNVNRATADVDSYQATIYGDHKLGEHSYVNAMAAYVWNNNDTARFNVGGVPNLTARGKFNSNQLALRAEVGRHVNFGRYTLTPNARLNYMHYTADDYTETGAGGANLNVKTQSLDSLEAGLGAKVSTMFKIKNSESAIVPSIQAGYRYGVINDPIEMSSSFTGGGASFQTEGAETAKHRFNFGTTAKYIVNEQWDLTASYTFDYKEDYTAHAGFLRVAYKF